MSYASNRTGLLLSEAYDTSGHTSDVILSVDGQTAYVADGYSGLQIIDVSDGSSSMLLGTYNTSGAASVTLSTDGQTAYVADSDSGLQIIDVSDGSSPVLLGTYNTSGVATDVTLSVDGQTAYVADGYSGLQIIRISDLILDSLSVVENSITGTVVGDLSAIDSEGNATRFNIIDGTGYNLFLINSNNQLVVKSGTMIDYEMLYANPTVTIRTTDSGGLSFDKTLTVSVINVNEAPVNIGLFSTTIEEHSAGGAVVGDLTATDPDTGDTHSFTVVGGSGLSQFEINANSQLVVKSGAIVDYETLPNPTVTIEVKDSGGLSYQKNFTITVEDIVENAVPVIDIGSSDLTGTVIEDSSWIQATGTVKATDSDKDPITYSVVNSSGTYGTLKFDYHRLGQWRYSLDNQDPDTNALGVDESGTDTFTVKVKDNQGGEATQTVTITVTGHNDAPVVPATSPSSYSVQENRTAVTTIHFDDVDDNQLDYAIAGGTDQLLFIIDPVTGGLSFKSAPDYETPIDVGADNRYQVTVSGSDGDLAATQDLTIIVTDVNEVIDQPFIFTPAITTASAASIAQYGSDYSGGSSEVFIKLTLSADMAGLKSQTLIDQVESIGEGVLDLNLDWSQFEAIGNNIAAAGTFYQSKKLTSDSYLQVNTLEDGIQLTVGSWRTDEPALTLVDKLTPTTPFVTDLPTRVDLATLYLNPKDNTVVDVAELTYGGTVGANYHQTEGLSFTQSLSNVGGTGSTLFEINGNNQLVVKAGATLDYETLANPRVTIRTTDSGGLTFDKTLALTVADVNEAPTDITLSSNTIEEKSTAGAIIGDFSATDPDLGDTHSFSVIEGTGFSLFEINASNQLVVKSEATLDYETLPSPMVTIRTTDSGGLTFDKTFTVSVQDVDELPPIDISLDNFSVVENSAGSHIANINGTDSDGDTLTYSIVGGADAELFLIETLPSITIYPSVPPAYALRLASGISADYEMDSQLEVQLQATDTDGLTYQETFVIAVINSDGSNDGDLQGTSENDIFNGGPGSDVLYGYWGDDIFYITSKSGVYTDTVEGGQGSDTLVVNYAGVNSMADLSIAVNGDWMTFTDANGGVINAREVEQFTVGDHDYQHFTGTFDGSSGINQNVTGLWSESENLLTLYGNASSFLNDFSNTDHLPGHSPTEDLKIIGNASGNSINRLK